MIRLTVMYPFQEGARFDHAYYAKQHMDLAREALAAHGLRSIAVEKGVAGGRPDAPPPYTALGVLTFETLDGYREGFKLNGKRLMADLPNFTDITPQVQVSEVLL